MLSFQASLWLLVLIYTRIPTEAAGTRIRELTEDYLEQRRLVIEEERKLRVGSSLVLSPKEQLVNKLLMKYKIDRIETSRLKNIPYPPSVHFFQSKEIIERTPEYDIIRMMPKGGNLHLHTTKLIGIDWLIHNLTHLPNVYSKMSSQTGARQFQMFDAPPENGWENVAEERSAFGDPADFDKMLHDEISLWVPNPQEVYPTSNDVWDAFWKMSSSVSRLFDLVSNYLMYLEESLRQYLADGVMYMELRAPWVEQEGLSDGFLDGALQVVEKFKRENPSFYGLKFIMEAIRMRPRPKVLTAVMETMRLMQKYPDLVKGFDVVGHESAGHPDVYYLDQLLYPKSLGFHMPFFLHAGETDLTGESDLNLVDALLLNATRIGHGLASTKHPKVMEAIEKGKVTVELNPISNQVLGYVKDLRNHPGTVLLARNARVVIASDDPCLWNARPLSDDFYMAFMGLGAKTDDLRLLKQLAINSIRYSTMTSQEQEEAMGIWRSSWDAFIDDVISKYDLS